MAILFVWLAATAWVRPLSLPDEGRYVGVAWEMLRSGSWWVPTLDGLPYFHKPPLFYWTTASALATFGLNEWAARLTSLIAATGSAYALYLFTRRWCNHAIAPTSLLVLATTPLFFGAAQFANLDMLVAACITCTVLCAADSVLSSENGRPRRPALAGAFVFAALGTLAKGLIGIVIPTIVIGAWLLMIARPAMVIRLIWLPGLAMLALIAVPWFALMQARYPGFLEYFFLEQHLRRFMAQDFNNQMPFWFYLAVFPAATLPWSPILIAVFGKTTGAVGLRPEVRALMWVWLVATVVFFSIPKSKLIGYVVPAAYPFAVLVAHGVLSVSRTQLSSRLPSTAVLGASAATVCMAVLAGFAIHDRNGIERMAIQIRSLMAPGDLVIAVGQYPFSVPFYLHYRQSIPVAENWDAKWSRQKDTWRKELNDAANFDPERSRDLLLRPSELALKLCGNRVWVFGSERASVRFPELKSLEQVARNHGNTVWLARPTNLRCSSTVN